MFDPEFYPTPVEVIDQMGIDCYGKVCYEPQAGSGNIVRWLQANGAHEVIACERQEQLRKILSGTCRLLGADSFHVTAEDISHVQLTVMNPPFSNAAAHILHAWKIAPEGCEIVSLCNWETVAKDLYGRNSELAATISNYGEALNMGDCFRQAERSTKVEIGLVRLFKPVLSEGMDMDGFYLTDENEQQQQNGIIGFNEIKAVVNSYLAAVRCFERVEQVAAELGAYTNVTILDKDDKAHTLKYGHGLQFVPTFGAKETISSKQDFARGYQKVCWRYIFDRVGIDKYVTSGVLKDVNTFIESRQNYPFTVRNIGRMLDIIVGTREQTMNRAIVEAVDNFTRHTHENRYAVEGWKTNEGHLLSRKFITPYIAEGSTSSLRIRWHQSNWNTLLDLVKAVCYVTGRRYDDIPDIRTASVARDSEGNVRMFERYPGATPAPLDYNSFTANTWYDWGFFRFKVYKKGTGHFQFKSEDDWAMLNRAYAKIKGQVLPEKTKRHSTI